MPTTRRSSRIADLRARIVVRRRARAEAAADAEQEALLLEENGHKVCGDALPRKTPQRAHRVQRESGLQTGEIARAMTADERAASASAANRRAWPPTEAARLRRDMAMAESYATEADLRNAFGERIDLIEESLKASQLGVIGLRQTAWSSLLGQAGDLELSRQAGPAALAPTSTRSMRNWRSRCASPSSNASIARRWTTS